MCRVCAGAKVFHANPTDKKRIIEKTNEDCANEQSVIQPDVITLAVDDLI